MSESASMLILRRAPDTVDRYGKSQEAATRTGVRCFVGDRRVTSEDMVSTTADSTPRIDSLTRVGDNCQDRPFGLTSERVAGTRSIGDRSFSDQIRAVFAPRANTKDSAILEGAAQ